MTKFQDDLLNEHIYIHDDNFLLFVIFQNANSYYFINQYGYYWYHGESTSSNNNLHSTNNANKSFHEIFTILKFIFTYTPYEEKFKMMCFSDFKFFFTLHGHKTKYVTEGFEFAKEVLNLYLNCRFYNKKQKKLLMEAITLLKKKPKR